MCLDYSPSARKGNRKEVSNPISSPDRCIGCKCFGSWLQDFAHMHFYTTVLIPLFHTLNHHRYFCAFRSLFTFVAP